MSTWQALLLGLLQGFTEFLPISSSGHLVLASALLDRSASEAATFTIFVHLGTAASVALAYRTDLARIVFGGFRDLARPGRWRSAIAEDGPFRLMILIGFSALPAALIGISLEDRIEATFGSARFALGGLAVTGLWLTATRFAPRGNGTIGFRGAILLGLAQAAAILPGISRSGSTIGAGLFAAYEPERLARFAFLMSLPVILGAALLQVDDLLDTPPSTEEFRALAVGSLAAFAAGFAAIRILIAILIRGRLHWFGLYCLLVASIGLAVT